MHQRGQMLINYPYSSINKHICCSSPLYNQQIFSCTLLNFTRMIIPGDCCRNACAPCHIFMTDYLKRGSLTVISAMTFTECLCGTERHETECGRAQVNGFLSLISREEGFAFSLRFFFLIIMCCRL